MSTNRFLIGSGILAPGIRTLLILTISYLRPEYSYLQDIVSALGAFGAAYAAIFNLAGMVLTGFLILLFSTAFYRAFSPGRISFVAAILLALCGAGYLVAGVLPCDPGCLSQNLRMSIHIIAGVLAMLSGMLAPLIFGLRVFRDQTEIPFARLSLIFGFVGLIAFVVLSLPWIYYPYGGLVQKLVIFISDFWIFIAAVYLLQKPRQVAEPHQL